MGFSAFDERHAVLSQSIIHDTDGTTFQTVYNPTSGPVRIDTWSALSLDTLAREFIVEIQNTGGVYQVCYHFTVPALAGNLGHAPFDILAAILPTTNQGLVLPPNQAMEIGAVVALSAGTYITFTLIGGVI